MTIGIIDYGAGNLRSIENAFKSFNSKVRILKEPDELEKIDSLVLPGVGNFGDAMKRLRKFREPLLEKIDTGMPFLGLCLGIQLIFEKSEESPGVKGLEIFEGKCIRFKKNVKIPHMGWNQIEKTKDCKILKGIESGSDFYFVHSYHVVPKDRDIIVTTTNYGIKFPSVIEKDNIFATQFHPERSGALGLKILKNFLAITNER